MTDATLAGELRTVIEAYVARRIDETTNRHPSSGLIDVQVERSQEIVRRLWHPGGLVLPDPVGTGKTVVALAATQMLVRRRRVTNVLVVAPNATVAGLWLGRAIDVGLDARLFSTGQRWRHGDVRVVTRHELADVRPFASPETSLVIVDEAHRGLTSEAFTGALNGHSGGSRLLLATATPFQMSTSALAALIELGQTREDKPSAESLRVYGRAVLRLAKACHSAEAAGKEIAGNPVVHFALDEALGLRDAANETLTARMLTPYPLTARWRTQPS